VQHWWLPQSGQGVRTRISDDRAWLAFAAANYIVRCDDEAVLEEKISFLEGPALSEEEHDAFFQPTLAEESGSLFEHCARALDRSLAVGAHGLPLMGTGDWNDGMNLVGVGGRGESVWLAWFLSSLLTVWAPIAQTRGEGKRAATWKRHAAALQEAIEREGWDGDWYRRAYFDDGTPLGSAVNDACAIDSIAQTWGVMTGSADPERARRAMASVDQRLVRRSDGLTLLLAPPFDNTPLQPGYIKGYLPGVRENGGQYTHAAAWVVIAFAILGDGDQAAELLAMLNPISHTATPQEVRQYQREPYVVAGDVYSEAPHVGRGGWSWYTGSAGWLYRAGIEWLLGFRLKGTQLVLDPCIPRHWEGFTIAFRYRSARYDIVVENPRGAGRGVATLELDGVALDARSGIPLVDDHQTHRVRAVLG
jgi:cyclic beta-1,2-glucan synthetase